MSTPTRTGRPTTQAAPPTRAEYATPTWAIHSACYNRPTEWWDDDAPLEVQEKAKAACRGCPVLALCLDGVRALEGRDDVGRTNLVAALTGRQRDWLHRQARKHGAFDAEEARLLALEATVAGRPLREIADREGVGGLTLRLAEKMLPAVAEEPAPAVPVKGLRPGEKVLLRMEEVLGWRQEGASLDAIAGRVGVSRRTASDAIKKYLGMDELPALPTDRQSKEERIEEIAAHRRDGLSWVAIDELADLRKGTTYRFVSRWRDGMEARGEKVPRELQREVALLTEAQVVRLRERAVAGKTDVEQALELGVARKVVTDAVSGVSYRQFGGPIRPKRQAGSRPCEASRTLWRNGQAGFAKAS
ncbi:hypothetical protein ACFW81_23990 [Streptomyces angustmyceticus]|uniref:hypothetical protein n=1 Tax=Streptomyces angustmyceticus TaxID=285578 RepID=UPI0036ABDE64